MNFEVDFYFNEANWQEELEELRRIVLDCGLIEVLKWGVPCYMFQKNNIILLGRFKEYCTISFLKGALLNDENEILSKPGENTQAARLVRFTNIQAILDLEPVLKNYIYEAMEVEKLGLKVHFNPPVEFIIPEELQTKFDELPTLQTAFEALTPGRQRAYNMHFSAPKQSKTRTARIEKYVSRILNGKGFNDCTCGLSKKMPSCDGSHKYI